MVRFTAQLGGPLFAVMVVASACSSGNSPAASGEGGSIGDAADVDGAVAADGQHDAQADTQADAAPAPAIGDCPMGPSPNLPPGSPRILLIAPSISRYDAPAIARHLQGLFAGDVAFQAPEVVVQITDTSTDWQSVSLMGFWYSPGGRDARIAPLAGPFTWVVMLDDANIALKYPELHFEGVRVVACRARAAGAQPIVLQTWTEDAADTDARGEIAYRVGNGTGTPVVPVGYAWQAAVQPYAGLDGGAEAGADAGVDTDAGAGVQIPPVPPPPGAAFVAAASVYSAITGKSAATSAYQPAGIPAADEAKFAAAAENAVVMHATMTHYTAPFASVVQLRTIQPQPELWFMSSGSSSEAIWFDRMNEIVPKLGMTPQGTALGYCNDTKTFDATCLDMANASFASAQYRILFARDYSVSAATTVATGMQNDLQVQVWDRHFDADPADGAAAVASLEIASIAVIAEARKLGLAWIPYHLMFAKLKTARPSVQLTSDGIHTTYPVGYGLAAMSVESRTSLPMPTAGLDADTVAAVQFADETIKQLSSLSQWGTYVADDPTTRPKVR